MELDAIDRRILRELCRDGRLSNVKLAERVGLSPTPCWNRVRALEEGGVIDGYAALAGLPEVVEAFLVSGGYDYLIKVAVAGTEGYESFLRHKLYRLPGFLNSRSIFALRCLKRGASVEI